jgi:uncharacterized protein YbjT (DUF2867 family)
MHLVVGATGLVGQAVALELAKAGERVRALTRRSDDDGRVAALRAAGVEEMDETARRFGIKPTPVEDFARRATATAD